MQRCVLVLHENGGCPLISFVRLHTPDVVASSLVKEHTMYGPVKLPSALYWGVGSLEGEPQQEAATSALHAAWPE
jgi:hypothetical protein